MVAAAILYDLAIGKSAMRPTREMGEAPRPRATDKAVVEGAIGAGTGATVGKMLGMKNAMKSGIGTFTVELEGPYQASMVSALAAVNALGDVIDPATGKDHRGRSRGSEWQEFANGARLMKRRPAAGCRSREHHAGGGRHERRSDQGGSDQAGATGANWAWRARSIR